MQSDASCRSSALGVHRELPGPRAGEKGLLTVPPGLCALGVAATAHREHQGWDPGPGPSLNHRAELDRHRLHQLRDGRSM